MISLELALLLQDAGLGWEPSAGDRFVVPGRGMDDSVFVVSDMTIEVHDLPSGRIFGFNGTTEWALDSVTQKEAVWLPREEQLRERLGTAFRRLERLDDGYRVVITDGDAEYGDEGADPEQAYGWALLHLLRLPK